MPHTPINKGRCGLLSFLRNRGNEWKNVHEMSTRLSKCPFSTKRPLNVRTKCPNVQNREAHSTIRINVYGGFVRMSGQMSKCPHNVQMSTFPDKNVAKMSTRMSNKPSGYLFAPSR